MLEREDAERLRRCMAGGGVAVFPADTVYGLCCDPENERAVERLYALKRRPAGRPAAVMFFNLDSALTELADLASGERAAIAALLPGPVTLLLPNRGARFPLACGPEPETLGLRVPELGEALAALGSVELPVMQSSANISGGPDPRRLSDVPPELLEGADLMLDGGELGGTPSTVLDLRYYDATGEWHLLREGPLSQAALTRALDSR
jgi:L-threonylcarbamoyladenylate synthase